jgi:hypothetical protein
MGTKYRFLAPSRTWEREEHRWNSGRGAGENEDAGDKAEAQHEAGHRSKGWVNVIMLHWGSWLETVFVFTTDRRDEYSVDQGFRG